MTEVKSQKDIYRTSRLMYIIEACVENFITLLTGGVYLATLTKALGISDSLTAILSSVTSLAGLFQIITVFVAHKTPVKRWIVPLQLISDLMLCGLYLIPVVGFDENASLLFFILIIGANAIKSIKSSVTSSWFFAMVDPEKRGSFSGILTAVSVIGQLLFSLGASYVFDLFIDDGNIRGAFTVITFTILVLIVLDVAPLVIAKEKPVKLERAPSPFTSLRSLFANPRYRKVLLLGTIQAIAIGITLPFLGTYQTVELGFSLSFIAIVDVFINAIWICTLLLLGRMSRRICYSSIMRLSAFFNMIASAILIFTMPANGAILFVIYRAFYIIQHGATAVAKTSLIFDIVPPTERTSALAMYTMISGVLTFLVTLSITPLFSYLQKNPPTLFGTALYAQQVLAIIAFAVMLLLNVLWLFFAKALKTRYDLLT